jgi:Raf kinase inhibitor-like YbhB/YbcL family protein
VQITSNSFNNGERIPEEFAFGRWDPDTKFALGGNRNPELTWSGVPDQTRSYVIVCDDGDVPTVAGDINVEGRTIPADQPRQHFCHWVMVDIPRGTHSINAGDCSDGVTPKGKQDPPGPSGSRQGVNDYTGFMAGNPDMAGKYFGYDGPASPWNDELIHRYDFTVYALDTDNLDLPAEFTLADVEQAIEGHVLDQATITGTYTTNPDLL